MNYFSPPKSSVRVTSEPADTKLSAAKISGSMETVVSTLGPDASIVGQIVSGGVLQVYGRVEGDIRASRVAIASGALVQGDVVADEALVEGEFKGIIRADIVKLGSTAVVRGEIYNRLLSIEGNADFEGASRRLDRTADVLSMTKAPLHADSLDIAETLSTAPVLPG